ncbi:MAG: hypothetical protein R2734_11150 [Nocardioides sp.]
MTLSSAAACIRVGGQKEAPCPRSSPHPRARTTSAPPRSKQTPSGLDPEKYKTDGRLKKAFYEAEIARLQEQLVLLQYWIQTQGLKVAVIFEGRGSAGKGGVIKRITERTSPRTVRVRSRCPDRPTASRPSGTSSGTSSICRPPGRW